MRSYELNRKHQSFTITENDELIKTEFYDSLAPNQFFLQQLDHPTHLKRSKTFKKNGILKLNDWKNNSLKWLNINLVCGDTIEKVGLLREFSLSQFTYLTIDQYLALEKEVQSNKRRYNQSYEGYFLNDDGTLDYQLMIQTIDSIITTGSLSINKILDQNRHRQRDLDIQHSETKIYQAIKAQANGSIDIDYLDDEDSNLQFISNQYDGDLPDFDL